MSGERLICGLQPVREAIAAWGTELRVVVEDKRDAPQLDAVARFARARGATVERARRGDLDRASHGVRHQGVIAWAPPLRVRTLDALDLGEGPALVVVLDSIEDPQNFGAIVRSTVALGATAILWPEHGAAPLTPATFRASAGAIEHAQLCSVPSLPAALAALRGRGLRVLGLDAAGDRDLDGEDLAVSVALVLGAEGAGLHKSVRRACDALVRLPMQGPIASLNVSAAAAIALYEAHRQRTKKSSQKD
jgi:23S rRNA (guanosine2251-2'-O)-methyltransferase